MNGYQPPLVPQSAVTFGNERLVDPWAETMLRNTCSNFQVQNMALQQENAALKTKNQSLQQQRANSIFKVADRAYLREFSAYRTEHFVKFPDERYYLVRENGFGAPYEVTKPLSDCTEFSARYVFDPRDGSTLIEVQYRLPNGKRASFSITVMKTVGTYVTREEAEAARAEMMKRPATPYQDSTLAKIHEVFLESREYKGRSDKTRELYDLAWKYLKPLWYYKITALYAQDFQNTLDKMADDGLSQSMLEKERTLISKLYRTAIGWRVVDANLASVLKVEGRKSPEREIFTDEQITLILSQKNTPTGQMVIALLACGVRIYELLHFKHEDFHRTESGAYLIGGCKTEAGRNRIIPILDFGIPIFEHAYATSVENSPLFPNGKGGFWNEKNWRNRKFYPFLEEIGIQPNPYDENGKRKPEFSGKLATYTPYTTRHTYASLCDRAGVNKDILKRAVGHTPKSKTLDEVYLHPKANQMIEAFDSANQLVKDEVLALPEE